MIMSEQELKLHVPAHAREAISASMKKSNLPITLGICLIAAKSKKIMGAEYKHPTWLLLLGVVVVILSAYLGVTTFMTNMAKLF